MMSRFTQNGKARSEEIEIVNQLDAELKAFKSVLRTRRSLSPTIPTKSFVFQPSDEHPATLSASFDDPDVWRPPTSSSSQDATWACGSSKTCTVGCGAKSSASKGSSGARTSIASETGLKKDKSIDHSTYNHSDTPTLALVLSLV